MLVKLFREKGPVPMRSPVHGRVYTASEIADEIERMTDVGQSMVAVAGIVLQALNTTPEFFAKPQTSV